jgi:hypothetical protein
MRLQPKYTNPFKFHTSVYYSSTKQRKTDPGFTVLRPSMGGGVNAISRNYSGLKRMTHADCDAVFFGIVFAVIRGC